jgi:gas vesicle protein
MSDKRGGGFGSFLFGIAVGAVVGFFFAPEAGEGTRRKLSGKLRNLRDLAEEKVDEVRGLLAECEAAAEADDDDEPAASTREQLRERLQAARRRRGRAAVRDEEDESPPLA